MYTIHDRYDSEDPIYRMISKGQETLRPVWLIKASSSEQAIKSNLVWVHVSNIVKIEI